MELASLTEIARTICGFALGGGVFAFVWTRAASRWRALATLYPSPRRDEPHRVLWLETVILHSGKPAFSNYTGLVTARIYADGVALSLLPPWSFAHPRLFFPFSEVTVESNPWYVLGQAFEIKAQRAPNITIVIHETLAQAITSAAPQSAGLGAM